MGGGGEGWGRKSRKRCAPPRREIRMAASQEDGEYERLLAVGRTYSKHLIIACRNNLRLKQWHAARNQAIELLSLADNEALSIPADEVRDMLCCPEVALVGLARKATLPSDGSTCWVLEDEDGDDIEGRRLPAAPLQGVQSDARSVCPLVLSPIETMDCAFELASVGSDDVLADLGCGDGRVLLRAARSRHCHAIGYDVNPFCLERSQLQAKRCQLSSRIEVHECSLHEVEMHPSFKSTTVVYVYLQPRVVESLCEMLQRIVRAGKRVVVYCTTGSHPSNPGNALGELSPSRVAMGGMLRLYSLPRNT